MFTRASEPVWKGKPAELTKSNDKAAANGAVPKKPRGIAKLHEYFRSLNERKNSYTTVRPPPAGRANIGLRQTFLPGEPLSRSGQNLHARRGPDSARRNVL